MTSLRLATRSSPLALAQAQFVAEKLLELGISSEFVTFETSGDRRVDEPLTDIGGQGVFSVEIQRAVLEGRADVAVHSAKDLTSTTPDGLCLSSTPERRDPTDVLVGRSLAGLGPGATVATGSPRRRALLLERRPDLTIVGLRGNMATRLDAVGHGGVDAVVAAAAALERLGWTERIAQRLDPQWFVPQVGQGTLALETRDDDHVAFEITQSISRGDVMACLVAERAFLRELGVGCSVPVAAFANSTSAGLQISGVMASFDGSRVLRARHSGSDAEALGTSLARELRDELGGASLDGWSSL